MRAIWKGSITFGLVNVPVRLYSATEEHDLSLHQVHDADGGRIRYERRCEVCGRKVAYEHIDKAFDDGEQTVVLTEDDLSALPAEHSREIDVVEFVPTEQVDPILFDRSYYLEPDSRSGKAYVLLRRVLEETDRTAIVRLSLRQRTRLGAMRVQGDVLMIQTLRWADEIREASFESLEGGSPRISAREMELARSVVEDLEGDFDPAAYEDDYQVQLRTLVEAKLDEGEALDTAATFGESEDDEGGEVIDLMEALQRSVDRRRGASGASGKGSGAKKTAAKKTAAKKTAAKKPSAKKTAAKKTAAKKASAKKASATKASARSTSTRSTSTKKPEQAS
ncbi:Ku protein [Agrococcus sp. SL85]|uniref:non-homologous end joining protein Ku n=1 Tax=Agrococcus sp. SL85 TaxID=2995141 RepID=UPI00226D0578|nr:Ku protein [Agrococcus sp. SL85]WAC67148.1 Ku protein [Agrococcus sp. SL85]